MASTVWKGYITFGLISIPIRLFAAARGERVSFHQIHNVCSTRIRQQLYCPSCERVVERKELLKGYPVEKDRFVTVTEAEVKKIAPPSSDNMEIVEFVHLDEIDPIYYDASYYAVPEDPGRKAYSLLMQTMQKSGYAAIAKVGMHQREYTVVIRPREQGMAVHTMYYPNEVREVPDTGKGPSVTLKAQEVELAEKLVKSLAGSFHPEKYKDEYQERLVQLVEAKGQGAEMEHASHKRLAPVVDLMAALQKSLKAKEAGAKKTAARESHSPAAKRRKLKKAS